MKKVLGYIRVSTEEQAKEGWSLDAQQEKINLYCKLHELNLFEIISDEGISACNVRGRPGMMRLLELTANGKKSEVQAIVTVKLDRLFRNAAEALKYSENGGSEILNFTLLMKVYKQTELLEKCSSPCSRYSQSLNGIRQAREL